MSDQGEKTCPLCAEEMDLTDQQLKPCKCGYEICVWCWHHIMDMAEKDDSEGRCPACRAPYDKEKIVGTAANCERLVVETSSERKGKTQKSKNKTLEGRKQLSSVRVIQRNLVYIVGLPLNLADEDLLQRREYFGQYGKVLKVSMSRTATGVIQQFPNSTCSVYITYSKEEEAVRCIQIVHGFILDGRSLRACFGTTKYCHAWLRNVACTNPDCLYLHEVGSHEDSFTKDEIISQYTRDRVQQITGATYNLQRRSGSMLPSPADDNCHSSSASTGKPIVKNASNTTTTVTRSSPPNGSSSRSVPLPAAAAWGMRASNCQSSAASLVCSNGPAKLKSDSTSAALPFSSAVASTVQSHTLPSNVGKKPTPHEESHITLGKAKSEPLKSLKHVGSDYQNAMSERSTSSTIFNDQCSSLPASKDNDRGTSQMSNTTNSFDSFDQPSSFGTEEDEQIAADEKIQNLCSDMSSLTVDRNARSEHPGISIPSSFTDQGLSKPSNQVPQNYYTEQYIEPLTSPAPSKHAPTKSGSSEGGYVSAAQSAVNTQVLNIEEDILSFESQRLKDPEVVNHSTYFTNANLIHGSNLSRSQSLQQCGPSDTANLNADPLYVDKNSMDRPLLYASNVSATSNGFLGHQENSACSAALNRTVEHLYLPPNYKSESPMGRAHDSSSVNGTAVDKGESSIISNILSMDFDAWDDSLTSPQNLAKLLGNTDKQSPLKIPSPWKAQNSNQSRFSFARQEESTNQPFDIDSSFSGIGQLNRNRSFSHDFAENRDSYFDKLGMGSNGFSYSKFEELDNFATDQSAFSSNKHSAISRGQVSAPPGFSAPSRPPPGFSSHERMDQTFDPMTGNHLLETSSIFRNSYPAQPNGNFCNNGDIEFIDPAILAVGKGRLQGGLNNAGLDMRSSFTPQLSAFENEARLRLLMQRSVSQQQNFGYPDIGDSYSHNDSYGISSRLMDQSHVTSHSPYPQMSLQQQQQSRNAVMSNGHWDGWNDVPSRNNLGVAELLRNERLGFNKFYSGYEDSKFRMPSSGDVYNRTFGM